MPSDTAPPSIDPVAARRWERMVLAESPWLHEEVARRMADRLQWIRLQPERWLHWAPGHGGIQAHALVAAQYPRSEAFVLDASVESTSSVIKKIVKPWWNPARWAAPRVQAGPAPDGGVQMVWANMALHGAADPQAMLAQWQRALAPQGFLMFSCLGPDTLRELRSLYAESGWAAPCHAFTDMHDWGDMLVQAGYAEPVMDMERIELSFAAPERLLQELRGLGRNLHRSRHGALRGRAWRARLLEALAGQMDGTSGALKLSFEIIYGHAIKVAPRVRVSEHSAVSLADMRAMLQSGKSAGG